jgi:hypothetical protein
MTPSLKISLYPIKQISQYAYIRRSTHAGQGKTHIPPSPAKSLDENEDVAVSVFKLTALLISSPNVGEAASLPIGNRPSKLFESSMGCGQTDNDVSASRVPASGRDATLATPDDD